MKRYSSFDGVKKKSKGGGGKVDCYGVSQGYYAVKTGATIGTSSLASCFALIATCGAQTFLAHVQAGTNVSSLLSAIDTEFEKKKPTKVLVVRGTSTSKPTQAIIDELAKAFPELTEETSESGAVAYDFTGLQKCDDIEPVNAQFYLANNKKGALLEPNSDIVPMDG